MFYDLTKRIIDILFSSILIVLFLPVWIIIPILILISSPGAVFYFQERVGKDNKIFRIIKFRTMVDNADDYWEQNPKLYEKFKKESWKLTIDEDPRITKLGKVLRQTSVDEFPQLFNILLGDMSLIGPRPLRVAEIADASKRYGAEISQKIAQSLTVKPGLSGPWQVSGRNNIPWDKRVTLDAEYARKKSILRDFIIMLKTPMAMISKW